MDASPLTEALEKQRLTSQLVCCVQVLYLDADNFVLRDPSALFDTQEYKSTAAIFWPDFWSNTLAPEVRGTPARAGATQLPAWGRGMAGRVCELRAHSDSILRPVIYPKKEPCWLTDCVCLLVCWPQTSELLGVPQEQWPAGSFESGQMVIDKSRHWRGLVTAMYINSYAAFW
jgi:hypothetical protein